MRVIIIAAAMLVVLAVATPGLVESWLPPPATPTVNVAATPAPAGAPRRDGVEIRAADNGHFYLDAEIQGRDVAVLVDTGASIVVLRESDARRAGIRVTRSDYTQAVSTANGMTRAAPVTLRSVAIGRVEIRDVRAVVMPDELLDVSLLGASFLNRLERFEVSGDTLVLEN
jgi:aspartyl protease family protein